MNKISWSLLLLIFCSVAKAQTTDSIIKQSKMFLNEKFASTRILDFQFEQLGARDFDAELFDKKFQSGNISNETRFRLAANLPVYKRKNYIITASLRYKYNQYNLTDVINTGQYTPTTQKQTIEVHYLSAAASFTYFSKLFNKPVIYNATLLTDGNEKGPERVKGLLAAALVLKRTQYTTITAGLIGFVDKSAITPVLPSFSWNQSFKNSPWSIDFILPQRLLLQRPVFKNARISLGSEVAGEGMYTSHQLSGLDVIYEYSQLEIRTGLIFEQVLNKRWILTAKGGIANTLNAQLVKKNQAYSKQVFKNSQNGAGYFNVGFSFNPFKIKDSKK